MAETGPPTRQRVVFAIGAGRSGSSSSALGVSALGVDFGDRFKRPGRNNLGGCFEDVDLLRLSKSVRLKTPEELQSPDLELLRQRFRRVIRDRFGNSPVWGFEYGRTLRILPLWEPVLEAENIDPSFVLALRNPISVARSRVALDPRRGRPGMRSSSAWRRWRQYCGCRTRWRVSGDAPCSTPSALCRLGAARRRAASVIFSSESC